MSSEKAEILAFSVIGVLVLCFLSYMGYLNTQEDLAITQLRTAEIESGMSVRDIKCLRGGNATWHELRCGE